MRNGTMYTVTRDVMLMPSPVARKLRDLQQRYEAVTLEAGGKFRLLQTIHPARSSTWYRVKARGVKGTKYINSAALAGMFKADE